MKRPSRVVRPASPIRLPASRCREGSGRGIGRVRTEAVARWVRRARWLRTTAVAGAWPSGSTRSSRRDLRDAPARPWHRGGVSAASTPEPAPTPAWVGEAVDAYAAHLLRERDRSEHTIRAYAGDVRACLMWCAHDGSDALADVTLAQLRSWLGSLASGAPPARPSPAGRPRYAPSSPGRRAPAAPPRTPHCGWRPPSGSAPCPTSSPATA